MTSAWALVWASVTVVAKLSQLFQPIGGVAAHCQKAGAELPARSRGRQDERPRPDRNSWGGTS